MRHLVFVLVALVACSKKEPSADQTKPPAEPAKPAADQAKPEPPKAPAAGGATLHCDYTAKMSTCSESPPGSEARATLSDKEIEEACTGTQGTFGQGPCPADGALGKCLKKGGQLFVFYKTGGAPLADAATAEKQCTEMHKGTWQP